MFAALSSSGQGEGSIRTVAERGGIVAVCLDGEFDVASAPALRDEIDAMLARGESIIVDLEQTTFVDSSIIHVLIEGVRAAGARDQRLVLQLGTAPIVERALEIVGVERVVARAHDRDEAVRMLEGGGHA
jgi:anti-sigma B factor antagonist